MSIIRSSGSRRIDKRASRFGRSSHPLPEALHCGVPKHDLKQAPNKCRLGNLFSLSEDLPLAIIIVDTAERADAFLDEIAGLVTGGLIIVDDVQVHTYAGGSPS